MESSPHPRNAGTTAIAAVTVNPKVCRELAELLKSLPIPADREDRSLTWCSPREVGNFYLLLVAISHQTSPRDRPPLEGDVGERHLCGWDYLSAKIEAAALEDVRILHPDFWVQMTAESVRDLFRDELLGERLSDPLGRALLVQNLGEQMLRNSWDWADQVHASARGCIATGSPNLLGLLAEFRAYQDPVHKKSFFFLALMQNSGMWIYADPEKLGAPIDYHEVRGHLRLGTVEIHEPQLQKRLSKGEPVSEQEDVAIRSAVHEAIVRISEMRGGVNPVELHYLFWNIFRSICKRTAPLCHLAQGSALPLRYTPWLRIEGEDEQCPFACICPSVDLDVRYVEHQFQTNWY
jgi:hypothetical protein